MMPYIPLSAVNLGDLERQYVLEALDLTMISSSGPHVRRFEDLIAQKVGVRYAVATASGTSALELLLRAMKIGPGDEVIVPALTFASPALAAVLVGAEPVFADITSETWTLDPDDVRNVLTSKTRAIIAVDVLGHPCEYDGLASFGLPIIEDAAEAHGATYKGRQAGSFGVASIFSFHANKAITCGEGGCILTHDGVLAERVRQLNAFGMEADRRYWHTEIGCNHRMTNLVAAVGLGQLERWDTLLAGRARVAAAYDRALQSLPLERRPVADWAGEAVWLYTVATDRRDAVLAACGRKGIDARALWPSLPENPAFARFVRGVCPRAHAVADRALWLPTWSDMPEESVQAVADAVAEVFRIE
jgi:perosamine synthetase